MKGEVVSFTLLIHNYFGIVGLDNLGNVIVWKLRGQWQHQCHEKWQDEKKNILLKSQIWSNNFYNVA